MINRPKLLLIGSHQSEWKNWRKADCAVKLYQYASDQIVDPFVDMPDSTFDPSVFDGVVFCTPNSQKTRIDLICKALHSGLPVLVMKMRVLGSASLDPIRSLPGTLRDKLWIGEQYRNRSGSLTVKKVVSSGAIGSIEHVFYNCNLSMMDRKTWMKSYDHLALEDLAYHHIAVLNDICGLRPGRLVADSWSPSWAVGSNGDYCNLLYQAANSWHLVYMVRWGASVSDSNYFGDIICEGQKGQIWTNGEIATLSDRHGCVTRYDAQCSPYSGWAGIVDQFGDMISDISCIDSAKLLTFKQFDLIHRFLYTAVESAKTSTVKQFE